MPFREDSPYWERYLRAYCRSRPSIVGAAVATANGEFIAAILPVDVDQRLFAAQVASFASSSYAIADAIGLDTDKPMTQLGLELGFVTICCYPTREIVLLTLWRKADWGATLDKCPDLTDPPTTAIGSKRIGPFPRFDEGEAEAEIDN